MACCMSLTDALPFGSRWAKAMYLVRHATWHTKVNVDFFRSEREPAQALPDTSALQPWPSTEGRMESYGDGNSDFD